jgi:hypothetical protein
MQYAQFTIGEQHHSPPFLPCCSCRLLLVRLLARLRQLLIEFAARIAALKLSITDGSMSSDNTAIAGLLPIFLLPPACHSFCVACHRPGAHLHAESFAASENEVSISLISFGFIPDLHLISPDFGSMQNKCSSSASWWVGHNGIPFRQSSLPLSASPQICAALNFP